MPHALHNRLGGETSPYLQQHAANPVAWQPWDAEALAVAEREDRPILLSIGYSACHWCHVMAHESFEDAAIAAVMNARFVNIKVDREERPDLDQIYQRAHQLMAGRPGGWPLTMFLAPDGTPFYGGTYFPDTPRHGLPGFADLCERVAVAWRERRGDITAQSRELIDALKDASPSSTGGETIDSRPIRAARELLLAHVDRTHGGFGGAPKFPHPTDLSFLLRRLAIDGDAEAGTAAFMTLTRMAEGGIYDQLGGGFARYSVDERWEIPHFEKMLYDNALLLGVYADAWALSGDPLYARVVDETADWLLREMALPEGGFASALDADSEGEEGRFYVWSRSEIDALLTPEESALAGRRWGFAGPPNFEGSHWHPRIATPLSPEEEPLAAQAREKLLAAREQRIRPGRDDKALTAWNALAIAALARAARIFGRPEWLAAARRAMDFIHRRLWHGGRLLAVARDDRAHLPAYLDDHAFLLAATIELMQGEFRADDLAFARRLGELLLECFEDRERGGFFFTAHDHEQLIARPKPPHDNALPSGNGMAAIALQRLGHLLGEPRYLDAGRRTLKAFWPWAERQPSGLATLLVGLEEALLPPAMVVLRGPANEITDWQKRLGVHAPKGVIVLPLTNEATPAGELPPPLRQPTTAHVNAWVCSGVTCTAPVADFALLEAEILRSR